MIPEIAITKTSSVNSFSLDDQQKAIESAINDFVGENDAIINIQLVDEGAEKRFYIYTYVI